MTAGSPINWDALRSASDPCLVCESADNEVMYPPTYGGSLDGAFNYFLAHRNATAHGPIVRCQHCGFVFTSPRFSGLEYDRIYKAVRPPENLDSSFESAKVARFSRLGAIVREFQSGEAPFLDFGCGEGGFLRVFDSSAGRGFEIGAEGRRMAGKCEIITGDWASVAGSPAIPNSTFNFVVAWDVLEHLPRISEDIDLIRAVLKPGGLFFASVPNIESLVARTMGKRWNMLLLEHLWYFSPTTFQQMMARHGFKLLATKSVPFDAPIAHIATRLAQTFGMKGTFRAGSISRLVLPIPAGMMLGAFRRTC